MSHDQAVVKAILDGARAAGRASLNSTESKEVCDAYGIPVPRRAWPRPVGKPRSWLAALVIR